ncbi:hypothetical protein HDU91_000703 [Kappamyces sp. JEL0680]|nr:hypothetical protein HDU91_000703 [Kappamyces sp. JEL0680]
MNVDAFSSSDNEFRNRFGSRYEQSRWSPNERPSTADYFRSSFKKIGKKVTAYAYPAKKSSRETSRTLAFYLGLFVVVVTVVVLFTPYLGLRSSSIADIATDSHHATAQPVFDGVHGTGKNPHINVPKGVPHGWRKKVFALRPDDVINHKYDHMVISILIREESSEDGLLHASVTTFLRQINRLQIASGTVADTFVGGSHNTYIPFQPRSNLFPKLEHYIDGFLTMHSFSPMQDWFMQVDEDTYMFMENLNIYLNQFKASDPYFFHNFDLVRKDSVHYKAPVKDNGHFPIGIMSRSALEILSKSDYATCILQNKYLANEETIFVTCLQELGVKAVNVPILHSTEPSHDFAWPADPCRRPLSFSQLSLGQLERLYKSQPVTGSSRDGSSYKWDTVVTYSDVFHHTFGSSRPMPGIDRHSASDSISVPAASGLECSESCKQNDSCLSWTFDKGDCYTSTHIGLSVPRSGVVSGVMSNRYNCNGASTY